MMEYSSFDNEVALKYRVYNSIFLTLKFDKIHRTGILLPVLHDYCKEGFEKGKSPEDIIEKFFEDHSEVIPSEEQTAKLFHFIQYVERQIVLVDALEDASFQKLYRASFDQPFLGSWTLNEVGKSPKKASLPESIKDFRIRIVLTAHPTQFYPGSVLGIITDLAFAVETNDLTRIRLLLEQLGKTPFLKREKPTPYDEAVSLNWFLENVFYFAISGIIEDLKDAMGKDAFRDSENLYHLIELGFWPGGDRDGNPFVDRDTTLKVAQKLQHTILKCYYRDIRDLKRRLTFRKVYEKVEKLEYKLSQSIFQLQEKEEISMSELQNSLEEIRHHLIHDHGGLFIEMIDEMITKVKIFGFHFASMDIRQDSSVVHKTFKKVCAKAGWQPSTLKEYFTDVPTDVSFQDDDPIVDDCFNVLETVKEIQRQNGEAGCHRYIISNCGSAESVAEIYAMAAMKCFFTEKHSLDVIPLFETIDDLRIGDSILEKLYKIEAYRSHLKDRENKQVVMLGFSDGTKDGGYFAANWSIYEAKEMITTMSRKYGVDVVFFDGRGGPPARGGGNVYRFYAAQGPTIENKEIQLTIQGQTVSSKFGNVEKARHYLERLLNAGMEHMDSKPKEGLSNQHRQMMEEIASISLVAYRHLKNHPLFASYLKERSPLQFFGKTNIASRPVKRGDTSELKLEDLRAIPFVGSWNQLKQNVPGYYGFGTALKKLEKDQGLENLQQLYKQSALFRSLVSNSMQSLIKCYFPLTEYLAANEKYGELWNMIRDEYECTRDMLLKVSESKFLLEDQPDAHASIQLREDIVLPLLTIQQYALMKLPETEGEEKKSYETLIVRSMYGIINAGRNSA